MTAIEESVEAVGDGVAARRLNHVDPRRCRFITGRVEETLRNPRLRIGADVVVLDPPRSGCDPHVWRHVLARLRPQRVVYVSCNPAALAVDLSAARNLGYVADRVRLLDMFPHTPHVEALAVLQRSR